MNDWALLKSENSKEVEGKNGPTELERVASLQIEDTYQLELGKLCIRHLEVTSHIKLKRTL